MEHRIEGALRHQFFGEYSAVVVLGPFYTPAILEALHRKLGDAWQKREHHYLVGTLARGTLDAFKQAFTFEIKPCGMRGCKKKCADEAIDGVPHSIDHGPPFVLVYEDQAPAEPDKNQLSLF